MGKYNEDELIMMALILDEEEKINIRRRISDFVLSTINKNFTNISEYLQF